MTLKEFREHIESFPSGTIFRYGISNPFSWRGSYDEVAFSIEEVQMSRQEILDRINLAYMNEFKGYKGGTYRYSDGTPVNFEEGGYSDYSGGLYVSEMISRIDGSEIYKTQEERLVKIAFK